MADFTALSTVKTYLGISGSSEDTPINAAIDAAELAIDNFCGREFKMVSSATAKTFRPDTNVVLTVPDIAKLDSLVVKVDTGDDGTYNDTLTLTTEYVVEGNKAPYTLIRRVDGSAFPRYRSNRETVEVTAFWGYGVEIPAPIIQAATVYSARLYQRRSSILGFQPGMEGDANYISRIDPDIKSLLAGYRLIGIA